MTPELVVDNVTKTYPNGVQALKGVSLRIPAGMFGLLGPNGAGKSTLMRTIATLQEPDGGSIEFGDIDVLKQKDAVRRTLGYLPQEFGLYPKVSALELLDHFAVLKEIGENVVVILSTHIVEDVSDLCSRMAIIASGQVLLSSDPQSAIDALRGRIWKKIVPREQLPSYERDLTVISTHLVSGRTAVHVMAEARPDASFEEVPADLEDVYFTTLNAADQKAA